MVIIKRPMTSRFQLSDMAGIEFNTANRDTVNADQSVPSNQTIAAMVQSLPKVLEQNIASFLPTMSVNREGAITKLSNEVKALARQLHVNLRWFNAVSKDTLEMFQLNMNDVEEQNHTDAFELADEIGAINPAIGEAVDQMDDPFEFLRVFPIMLRKQLLIKLIKRKQRNKERQQERDAARELKRSRKRRRVVDTDE